MVKFCTILNILYCTTDAVPLRPPTPGCTPEWAVSSAGSKRGSRAKSAPVNCNDKSEMALWTWMVEPDTLNWHELNLILLVFRLFIVNWVVRTTSVMLQYREKSILYCELHMFATILSQWIYNFHFLCFPSFYLYLTHSLFCPLKMSRHRDQKTLNQSTSSTSTPPFLTPHLFFPP